MKSKNGKKIWIFPDLELPPEGDSELKGHESIIILNLNKTDANITISLYFEDENPITNICSTIKAERVKCLRTNNKFDFNNVEIPKNKQYAIKIDSDIEVVAQYGRLDTRQPNMAFYTVMGYSI